MSMATRKEITQAQKKKYLKAGKKEKGMILDALVLSTGLSRDRLARIMREEKVTEKKQKIERRGRKPIYTEEDTLLLRRMWTILDCVCGLRLKAALPTALDALIAHGELDKDYPSVARLKKISVSTINRLLKPVRDEFKFRGRATTKPGTLLKHHIPIRLGSNWDENIPGFVEIDLVAHCGDSASGDYVNTLNVTDIATTWTETRAVRNKAQKHVFAALMHIQMRAPFDYLGIDSDNGTEFINAHLFRYCKEYDIVFTRSRPYRKNDSAHVEEKNWSIVRKHMGYSRFEGQEIVNLINDYYDLLRLHTNYFLPTVKLVSKQRSGSKVKKIYDNPQTPYARILAHPSTDEVTKKKLKATFQTLNPVQLKRDMLELQSKIEKMAIPYEKYH